MADQIKVAVQGVFGKMGRQVLETLCVEPDMDPVGAADLVAPDDTMDLPDGSGRIRLSTSIADVIDGADVIVDFTSGDGSAHVIEAAAEQKVNLVIGSTGIPDQVIERARKLADENNIGILIAPNFAIGGVVMIHLAKVAARFFDYADLLEMHHENKIDAPSGTALAIARAAVDGRGDQFIENVAEKELVQGGRGASLDGVSIHSARMPGRVAHHELTFGHIGQTLTIRHDSINRDSFMPGVMMAVRAIRSRPGLTMGLDKIMGL